jgi:hypothetical protein
MAHERFGKAASLILMLLVDDCLQRFRTARVNRVILRNVRYPPDSDRTSNINVGGVPLAEVGRPHSIASSTIASTPEARLILAPAQRFNTRRQDYRRFYNVGRN